MPLRDKLPRMMQLQIKIVEDPEWAANEIERLESSLRRIFLLSAADGNRLFDAIDIAANTLGPNKL